MKLATSALGTKRTSLDVRSLVAIGGKADIAVTFAEVRKWTHNGHRPVPLHFRRDPEDGRPHRQRPR